MRIYFTLFCEHISPSSYGRVDLTGVLPQKQMGIPHLPYIFKGDIAINLSVEALNLKKKLNLYNAENDLLGSFEIPAIAVSDMEKIVPFHLTWKIEKYGKYRLEIVFEDEKETYTREFDVIKGDAASLNLEKEEVPPQILLGTNDLTQAQDWLKKIFKKARKSILVVDNYWETKQLIYLLSEIKPEINLLLYTKKERVKEAEKVRVFHSNTVVQSSNKIHDRYICLDGDSEIWHIGSSLNHAGKKVTTINKITHLEAINKLKQEINKLFPNTFK